MTGRWYRATGGVLCTDMALPLQEIPPQDRADVSLVAGPVDPDLGELAHEALEPDGTASLRLWHHARRDAWTAETSDLRFALAPATITYAPHQGGHAYGPRVDEPGFVVTRVVLPLAALFARGARLAVHGSAVYDGDFAWIFAGQSGAGKSTAVYELVRRGARLLADDMSVLEAHEGDGVRALPGSPEVRLWRGEGAVREAVTEGAVTEGVPKRWFHLGAGSTWHEPAPVRAVALLDAHRGAGPEGVFAERLRGERALAALLSVSFELSHGPAAWRVARFRAAARVAARVPVVLLRYRQDPAQIERSVGALWDALQGAS